MQKEKVYLAIDLKSFYASVECVELGLDPLTTNLVVADPSRSSKTICLAVSPSLKAHGIPGRCRLFEVEQRVKEVNADRRLRAGRAFSGTSFDAMALRKDSMLAMDYIVAPPQMALYIKHSAAIYQIYLKYIAPEDIHVYSIDEVFLDVTAYLNIYGTTPEELAQIILCDVFQTTGITATAGIGSNLYLCKVALDIMAKKARPDQTGARIAALDEMTYRRELWDHRPLTDFWRIGRGYAKKLAEHGMYTMGDVARCSLGKSNDAWNEALLYRLFGVNAELLIDHAWGNEPCTMADIKAYRPSTNSLGSGQVLHSPYSFEKARLVVREMADSLVLDLVAKGLETDRVVLTLGYDVENLAGPEKDNLYSGRVVTDHYGRKVPKHAHGTENLGQMTSSAQKIVTAVMELYDRIVDPKLLVRRINLSAERVQRENLMLQTEPMEQLDLFHNYGAERCRETAEQAVLERERRRQKAILDIKSRFGKNAILRGMDLEDGATAMDRNRQIGGHKA